MASPLPYEWIYDLQPISIRQKVIEEIADHLLEDLKTWPPPVQAWLDAGQSARFANLYEDPWRPNAALWRRSLQIVRWELQHEVDAIDACMRNHAWEADNAGPQAESGLLLIWRWLTEVLLAVREHSKQNLSRADLVRVVDRMEPKLAPDLLRS